jgi:hypothetical protein
MEFNVAINPEENIVPRIVSKPVYNSTDIDGIFHTLDEGILDLATVKDISMGSRNQGNNQFFFLSPRNNGCAYQY